jgi:uncharacterized protein (DUF1499 family)/energy-converting hydrogenase Eha subunit A
MVELTLSAGQSRLARFLPWLGFAFAVIAGVLLALVPLGWRLGLWSFDTSFRDFMAPVPFVAAGAFVLSLVALGWWRAMSGRARLGAFLGLVGGALLVYYPLQLYAKVAPLPFLHNTPLPYIHDITTDPQNPPAFSATLAARAAEHGDTATYGGAALYKRQQAGYPDIAPLETALAPAEAFKHALALAETMPRWTIVKSDPQAGTIEGSARSMFMGFTDDFVIRVSPNGSGSRIDMRSESRQGRSDLGVNAGRIRAYFAALKPQLQ